MNIETTEQGGRLTEILTCEPDEFHTGPTVESDMQVYDHAGRGKVRIDGVWYHMFVWYILHSYALGAAGWQRVMFIPGLDRVFVDVVGEGIWMRSEMYEALLRSGTQEF